MSLQLWLERCFICSFTKIDLIKIEFDAIRINFDQFTIMYHTKVLLIDLIAWTSTIRSDCIQDKVFFRSPRRNMNLESLFAVTIPANCVCQIVCTTAIISVFITKFSVQSITTRDETFLNNTTTGIHDAIIIITTKYGRIIDRNAITSHLEVCSICTRCCLDKLDYTDSQS
ncbi:uncharacterized protein FA14DRAFT_8194 [Meira miltonrushii]|uniref:Uncharacterized protein n=1 Tax=Meira miltonrushii TaxID=1280837 RepID=A0A316VH09_9BASI|nr:uncharacterized protein FA14DRAFT_8194 [Meira miltonrushii]PWN36937.1 hypothetical protein FA14DRAFT_8194 [Meira miltonrushii]